MGYNTEFDGEFVLSRRLDEKTCNALEELAHSRHDDEGMPSIWCQWGVSENRRSIRWDGNEKFYGYIGWIRYINNHFLLPKKIKLNGTVVFQGEDPEDGLPRMERLKSSGTTMIQRCPTMIKSQKSVVISLLTKG